MIARQRRISLTTLQKKVLRAVSGIPFGQVRSYQWLAKRVGRPRAVRAVASALKKNQQLFMVPCHRVIRADGALGGYVLGQEIKAMLLDLERTLANSKKK